MARVPVIPNAPRPLVFAHRGYSSRAPENTMAAFRAAATNGVAGIELDIHRCRSGELVVSHDENLKRVTGREVTIADADLDAIRELDAGSWFSPEFASERIPLLREVLVEFSRTFYFDIEIKHHTNHDDSLETDLGRMILEFGIVGRTVVSSFDPLAIGHFKRLFPTIPTAIIYSSHKDVPALLRLGEGRFLSLCDALKPHFRRVSSFTAFFDRKIGHYPIIPWTVDDPGEARRLVELGVDGVISNDPAALNLSKRE